MICKLMINKNENICVRAYWKEVGISGWKMYGHRMRYGMWQMERHKTW
jgi:hypothetical protein